MMCFIDGFFKGINNASTDETFAPQEIKRPNLKRYQTKARSFPTKSFTKTNYEVHKLYIASQQKCKGPYQEPGCETKLHAQLTNHIKA